MASEAQALLFSAPAEGMLTAFRWTDYDVPFWARENSRSGRWNDAGIGVTQYWSLTPEAAWAELIRHEELQSEAEILLVRQPIWVARLPQRGLLDLRQHEQRARFDIDLASLTADDWSECQDLARRLRGTGVTGLIAPSAALDGHANITLFGPRREIAWSSDSKLASAVPSARVAVGHPPTGVVDRVIYRRRTDGTLF